MSESDPPTPPKLEAETPAAGEPPILAAAPDNARADHDRAVSVYAQIEDEFGEIQDVGILYGFLLLPLLVGIGWSYHTGSHDRAIEFWVSGALYLLIAIFAYAWRESWLHLLRLPEGRPGRMALITFASPAVTIVAATIMAKVAAAFGFRVADITTGFGPQGYPVWLLVPVAVVLPAVFEEIAFRGILLTKLQLVMGPTQATWVAAILFAVLHFSVISMAVFLIPLAVVAGYVTRQTRSLLPAVVMHALHNAGVVVIGLLDR